MSIFYLPDLGEGLKEAEVVAWHVAAGDHVIADQPLVSVETDKAVIEVPSPLSGTVSRLMAKTGDVVPVGGALVMFNSELATDKGAIVGEIDAAAPKPKPTPKEPSADTATPVKASPAVRKLAAEHKVDLAMVTGTGPGGAIQSADVLTAIDGLGEALHGPRRVMARKMERSGTSVVPATVMDHADISAWAKEANATQQLICAITAACAAEPALNAWFDGKRRQLHAHVDLAIAMDTPDGLFAPVLRSVETPRDLAPELAALKASVHDRTIAPNAMTDATITLSNFGMIGGEHAVLVVVPPQVAILGAGRIGTRIIMKDGRPQEQQLLPLSLSFDHRAVTGGEAARFLATVRARLETPSEKG
ncbi:dihydrolipoamide acetyltransferase family protein [Ruegeria arenilitoris]|uniref:dihydrolipoamide acetyltransferase family protein n=1 Tax=Ruegeria arenilitoris TaxID=1173585 RepID=UPI001480F507|nr:dihydrolipoamide acetyltransferase family protein [Ruegeria arenilitoris]